MAYVNTETGEWSFSAPKDNKTVKLKVKEYVGIDTPFPQECKDCETLVRVVKNIDPHLSNKIKIENKYILDSVVKGHLTPKCAESLDWICNNICAWNYVFTTKSELINKGFTTKANYAKWIKDMENFITVSQVHTKDKENIKIKVNPFVAWKGNEYLRKCAIEEYYSPI